MYEIPRPPTHSSGVSDLVNVKRNSKGNFLPDYVKILFLRTLGNYIRLENIYCFVTVSPSTEGISVVGRSPSSFVSPILGTEPQPNELKFRTEWTKDTPHWKLNVSGETTVL